MEKYRLKKYRDHWCAVWSERGRTRRASLGASVGEASRETAEVFLNDWIAKTTAAKKRVNGPVTIGTILDAYFEAKPNVVHRPQLVAFFRSHLPENLTKELVDSYIATRLGKAASTIRSEVGILTTALHWALKRRLIDKMPHVELPQASPPRERWISKAEADRLAEAAVAPHIKLFILLARYTGARAGAILGLTWNRVAERHIDYNDPSKPRSRKKRAVVPMHPELWGALTEARNDAVTPFVIEYGGNPVESVKKAFGRTAARAGLPRVGPHVLRHSVATWQAMDGIPMAEIAAFLGNSVKMVENVYAKYGPDYLSEAVASLGRGRMVHLNRNLAHKQETGAKTIDPGAKKAS